jgi:hypothetical protein
MEKKAAAYDVIIGMMADGYDDNPFYSVFKALVEKHPHIAIMLTRPASGEEDWIDRENGIVSMTVTGVELHPYTDEVVDLSGTILDNLPDSSKAIAPEMFSKAWACVASASMDAEENGEAIDRMDTYSGAIRDALASPESHLSWKNYGGRASHVLDEIREKVLSMRESYADIREGLQTEQRSTPHISARAPWSLASTKAGTQPGARKSLPWATNQHQQQRNQHNNASRQWQRPRPSLVASILPLGKTAPAVNEKILSATKPSTQRTGGHALPPIESAFIPSQVMPFW